MSRIGKAPVPVPSGVTVDVKSGKVSVKGAKGSLAIDVPSGIAVAVENGSVVVKRDSEARQQRALHGLVRSLVANMVQGVTAGFERKLEIIGVGFGAKATDKKIDLTVGYSRPVSLNIPEGVKIVLPDATHITVSGVDKQKVGQFAAEIRAVRKPEPYKGTGIKFEGELIRRKAGKAFGAAGK
jgi:large subunit ribosomal protein L6